MAHNQPKWKCENCGKLVTELSYCSSCWKMVCSNCHDPYVGACKRCVQELFKRNELQFSEAINRAAEKIGKSTSLRRHRNIVIKCKECYIPLIITPDGTKCCPRCGLVLGKGYSWMGRETPRDESVHIYEHHGEAYGM